MRLESRFGKNAVFDLLYELYFGYFPFNVFFSIPIYYDPIRFLYALDILEILVDRLLRLLAAASHRVFDPRLFFNQVTAFLVEEQVNVAMAFVLDFDAHRLFVADLGIAQGR